MGMRMWPCASAHRWSRSRGGKTPWRSEPARAPANAGARRIGGGCAGGAKRPGGRDPGGAQAKAGAGGTGGAVQGGGTVLNARPMEIEPTPLSLALSRWNPLVLWRQLDSGWKLAIALLVVQRLVLG